MSRFEEGTVSSTNREPTFEKRFVQFIHPGHEYAAGRAGLSANMTEGVMGWKFGDRPHNRKFLQAQGDAYDAADARWYRNRLLRFWGEWEPPSRVRRMNRDYQNWGLPSLLHEPIWPTNPPIHMRPAAAGGQGRQNTDPLVFGDQFAYSNCRQNKPVLRNLGVGSVVLFGRGSTQLSTFQLDTCLVVDARHSMREVPRDDSYGHNVLQDVVMDALSTEKIGAQYTSYLDTLVVYLGATPTADGLARPFSFFPAKLTTVPDDAFSKATVTLTEPLRGLFNPRLQQGFKATVLNESDLTNAWQEVVRQVTEQGYLLGTHAEPLRQHVDAPQVN